MEFSRRAAYGRGTVFIEGVGGIMVPLDQTHTVLDWMSALRVPVLLVAGSYLGTISHTLTALHVLAQRNLDIAGVVVSESTAPGASLDDTVATIARFAVPIDVIGVPRLPPGAASRRPSCDRLNACSDRSFNPAVLGHLFICPPAGFMENLAAGTSDLGHCRRGNHPA